MENCDFHVTIVQWKSILLQDQMWQLDKKGASYRNGCGDGEDVDGGGCDGGDAESDWAGCSDVDPAWK